jgi:hypothetical protein
MYSIHRETYFFDALLHWSAALLQLGADVRVANHTAIEAHRNLDFREVKVTFRAHIQVLFVRNLIRQTRQS